LEDTEGCLDIDHETLDAIAEARDIEVDQQPDAVAGEPLVAEDLSSVYWVQFANRFCLYYHCALHEEIDSIGHLDVEVAVNDGYRHFGLRGQASGSELISETVAVGAFQ
jgi:hypothetical protein